MSEKVYQISVMCEPDFSVVCGLLGEGRTDQGELKKIYASVLVKLRELVYPVVLMKQSEVGETFFPADASGAKNCTLERKSDTGDGAGQLLVLSVILTIGRAGEQYVRELFAQGEHLHALVTDAMLSAWLFAMDKKVQDEIRAFCIGQGVGVAKRLEAPDDLSPEMQGIICEALDAERLAGVRVTEAHMLVPEKSMCYVLELTDDCQRFAAGHDCEKCEKKDCGMRKATCNPRNMKQMQNSVDTMTKNSMIKILVEDQGKKYACEAGSVLIHTLREHGVRIDAPCGGSGRCGKCRVRVVSGELPVTAEDRAFLSEREIATGVRLACTARPMSDLRIRVLAKPGKQIAAVSEISNVRSGMNTGQSADQERRNTDLKQMPGDVMGSKNAKNASVYDAAFDKQGLSVTDENGYGIGIDIGTTTLAACLYGWSDGVVYETITAVNSGRDFGADVLSRMEASNNGKRARLQELLQEDVCGLLAELLHRAGVQAVDVKKMVIAANMTMVHLLMGYSCETLGRAPFVPANKRMICADAMRILGDSSLRCPVVILPAVSAFVGGDIVSGMLSLGMNEGNDTVLLLDVGTNGEMALRHNGQIYVTSTAAGPAFEGGGISCGCASVPGAICSVKFVDDMWDRSISLKEESVHSFASGLYQGQNCASLIDEKEGWSGSLTEGQADGSNYRTNREQGFMLRTIGDAAPVGICGSGVLELVSELLHVGLLDETGLLAEQYRERGFSLGKMVSGKPIVFTQGDVRALQLAKGAIRAGIEALLAAGGVRAEDVAQIYLAGGFGVRMDEQASIRIGLLPEAFRGRIRPVGNSSLSGAVFAGRCAQLGSACEELLAQCRQVVLAEQPEFGENYLKYMNF
ncbi:MAG: ASKHA domain-containing protein [Lachnospiraceae bacterium]|nr:ASKHA domain-containing protein [Lachnospiraceae bacterium]